MSLIRDDFRAARIRPSTAATTNPTTVACMVTTRPLNSMGSMELANSQSLAVFHSMPKSMSASPRPPAPDRALQQLHDGRQNQCHAKVHQQQQGVDRDAILCKVAYLLGEESQDRKSTRLNSSHSCASRMQSSAR